MALTLSLMGQEVSKAFLLLAVVLKAASGSGSPSVNLGQNQSIPFYLSLSGFISKEKS